MRPLKVTATFSSPIAGDVPMLDALLEWVMARRMESVIESKHGHRHLTRTPQRQGVPVVPGAIPIPIERRRVSGFPWMIPLCSSPIFRAVTDGHEHFARRLDLADPSLIRPDARRVFNVGSGEFKSYRLPLRVRWIPKVVWFCVGRGKPKPDGEGRHGAATEVRKLLKRVTAVGKKTSIGYGQVESWTVEFADEDWSWYAPSPAGPVLMRPLPSAVQLPGGVVGFRRWYGGMVAPYWCAQFYCEGVAPC